MISFEPLRDEFGTVVHGGPNDSLFALDREEVLARFRLGGVLLFRGFPVTEHIFREFTESYGAEFVVHHNLAKRDYIDDDHTFATVNRGQHAIDFHIEMASNPISPDVFWMYCISPAAARGRTGLVDGVQVLNSLTPATRAIFEEQGHRYVLKDIPPQAWGSILPWIEGRAGAEQWLRSEGPAIGVTRYHFDDADRLTLELYRCPIGIGKFCRQPVFVNGMLDNLSTPLGNRPMPISLRAEVCQAVYQHAVWIDWQPTDVALIDNTRVMHAREAFEGTQRRILVRYSSLRS